MIALFFDWIQKNKEWVFSGIGVALILLGVEFLRSGTYKKKKINEQIENIAKRYVDILDGKNKGHSGLIGLIESGAAKLKKNKLIFDLCEKIEEYGKPNPLKVWVLDHIEENDILNFIKWQSENKIGYSPHYFNENNFIKLVERYKKRAKT